MDARALGPGLPCTDHLSHCFLPPTSSFDHEYQFQTKTSRKSHLLAEYGYRDHESREGGPECDTSQGRFWFRQRSSDNDQGTSPHTIVSNIYRTIIW